MGTLLLIAAVALFVFAVLPLGVFLLGRERTFNLHVIWELAARGDRLARIYLGLSIVAFLLAFASVLMMRFEVRTATTADGTARWLAMKPHALLARRPCATDAQWRSFASLRTSPQVCDQPPTPSHP